jgi:hypothetical protein
MHEHNLNVPRNLVHAMMYGLDPEGLEARQPTDKHDDEANINHKHPIKYMLLKSL